MKSSSKIFLIHLNACLSGIHEMLEESLNKVKSMTSFSQKIHNKFIFQTNDHAPSTAGCCHMVKSNDSISDFTTIKTPTRFRLTASHQYSTNISKHTQVTVIPFDKCQIHPIVLFKPKTDPKHTPLTPPWAPTCTTIIQQSERTTQVIPALPIASM